MAKRKTTEAVVTFLLDKSGSMAAVKDDTIAAFNAYLEGLQADPDGVTFTFLQFDSNSVDTVHKNVPVKEALKLTATTYRPGAWTPLIDACCKTIKAVEESLAKRLESGGAPKVVVCFQTDGAENASRQFTSAQLQDMIKEKTALGWQFIFMGAGIDAYAAAGAMGVPIASTVSYDMARGTTISAFQASASNTMRFARGMADTAGYSQEQKLAAGDRFDPKKPKTVESKSLVEDIKL